MPTLQDYTNALYGKYNVGTLSATDLQANFTAICKAISTGVLSWVNEDCVTLIQNQSGPPFAPGQLVRVANSQQPDAIYLSTQTTDDWFCGVVYRSGDGFAQPVVVAIQGEYPVKIAATSTILPTVGNLITVSSTQGMGTMTSSQVVGIHCVGVCAETLTAYPTDRLVKCMIQNLQSL